MKVTLENTTLKIESEAGDPFIGQTTAESIQNHPQHGDLLRCGTVKVGRKRQNLSIRLTDKPWLQAEVEKWNAARKEEADRKAEEERAARERIRTGEDPIEMRYYDGEYLSGYMAFGHGADLLCDLGLAKEVNGWGIHVEKRLVDALGETITYPQAEEYSRPEREENRVAKEIKETAAREKKEAAMVEARRTGQPVKLDSWTEECSDPREECNLDVVSRWVKQDGTIEHRRSHTW